MLKLAEKSPDLVEKLLVERPILSSISEGRQPLEAALDRERRDSIRSHEVRLSSYAAAAARWHELWPSVAAEIAGLSLTKAHAVIVERASTVLPTYFPLWSPDASALFYRRTVVQNSSRRLQSVDVKTAPDFTFGNERTLPIERFLIFPFYRTLPTNNSSPIGISGFFRLRRPTTWTRRPTHTAYSPSRSSRPSRASGSRLRHHLARDWFYPTIHSQPTP